MPKPAALAADVTTTEAVAKAIAMAKVFKRFLYLRLPDRSASARPASR
jgi:hypothetical protein